LVIDEKFKNSKIISISSGSDHSLILLENNKILSFGGNEKEQIGDGTTINRYYPVEVNFTNIKKNLNFKLISSGCYRSIVITNENEIFSWGKNENGELGGGTATQKTLPVLINFFNKNISLISASNDFSLFLTENG
jgi:alpha-tubulin suppressor-like RCC1 family protein